MVLTSRETTRIIRPGFFMENFEGFMGSITYTVFREGLTDDTTLPLVVSASYTPNLRTRRDCRTDTNSSLTGI